MNTSPETRSPIDAELVVTDLNGFLEIRRVTAPNEDDPFVGVRIHDNPDAGHPYSVVRTSGVARYDDLERFGRNSVASVGEEARVEVKTGLIDASRRTHIAKKVAALAFELSEQE